MSTLDESSKSGADHGGGDRAVLCAKCEHLNRRGNNQCKRCGARLYVSCVTCGQTNERVRTRCVKCSRALHRGVAAKLFPAWPKKLKVDPVKVLAVLIGIFITYTIIILLGHAG